MTEQQIETLEKLFPKGFMCISVMQDGTLHIAYVNDSNLPNLEVIREIVYETVKVLMEKQEGDN
jgi:hypothetical protein